MKKSIKSKSQSKPKLKTLEHRFERKTSNGDIVEVIEETLPGKKEAYGNMLIRITNHNLYESGMHTLPGEKRYKEILKKKKEKECICGFDHEKECICGEEEERRRKKELEEKKRKEEERRRKMEEERLRRIEEERKIKIEEERIRKIEEERLRRIEEERRRKM